MESFKVIPAIDLMDGKCVRLVRGNYDMKTVYDKAPAELAKAFFEAGLDLLHVVDLDGARIGKPVNLVTVEAIAKTGIRIELGGGLRTKEHLLQAVDCGVTDLVLGSRLLSDEPVLNEWLSLFPGRLAAGIDARDGMAAVHGWESNSTVEAIELANRVEDLGFSRIIYTNISRDGTLTGPDLPQLETIANITALPVIASGGVRNISDILTVKKLQSLGVSGVIVGKAFYEGNITLMEMSRC